MELRTPVQAVVDRSAPLGTYRLDVDKNGKVVGVGKKFVDGRFGALPDDPGRFAAMVDPRLRGCEMFTGYGCLRGKGYF